MRIRRADLIAGACGVVAGSAPASEVAHVPGAVLIGAALGTARARPRATWLFVVLVTLVASVAQSALPGDGDFAMYMLLGAHGFAVGRFESGRWSFAGVAALTVAGVAGSAFAPEFESFLVFVVPAAWGAGRALRDRVLIAERLRARERELESERDAYAALSVRYERARIAAELHDIVAHAISVMVVQASAGQRLATRDRAATAEAFEAIAGAARDAEVDMARLVALLADAPVAPATDLSLVDELVARANRAGLDVTLRLAGDVEDVDPAAAQLVRRVVQEGLTNALRYAAGAPVTASVRGEPDALVAEVVNGPSSSDGSLCGTGTGNGLRGLRERVGAGGGSVVAEETGDGGWRLAARVPRRVAMR